MSLILTLSASIFILDYFLKLYLTNNFSHSTLPLIDNILHITVVFNKGAAFGILQNHTFLLVIIGIIFIAALLVILFKDKSRTLTDNIVFGLIIGGASSNLFDRIVYGHVIDYIQVPIWKVFGRTWPVFNISDSCICIAAVILVIKIFKKSG